MLTNMSFVAIYMYREAYRGIAKVVPAIKSILIE